MKWIKVSDRLPENEESELLVYGSEINDEGTKWEREEDPAVHFASYNNNKFNSVYYYNFNLIKATHWMPLPSIPPKDKKEKYG
jgi:hypothetical protein